jgi:hypothetical protein
MGSVGLIAVAHNEADRAMLLEALQIRQRDAARDRIQKDPSFLQKLRTLLEQ